jgi:phenylpropionate dioxygenase-like ring-hydroxylating dioxygenase large terminal subunit
VPLVLFRSQGRAAALLDRCPHRNVPLSLGRVLADGRLECAYHGWQFDYEGVCRKIPGLANEEAAR